jgi:transcription elongation factor GreA
MQTDRETEIILTSEGLKKIEDELEHLITVHRKRVAERIRDSKQFGEFSENSEYEDAKTEQAFVEGRIEELKKILMHAHVISDDEVLTDSVGVGSIVKVRDLETMDEWEYTIVGSIEANPAEDKISNESPVGEALVGRTIGEIVEIEIPAGIARYEIVSIRK